MQKEIQYLRSLQAVRDRVEKVREKAVENQLQYFEPVKWKNLDLVVDFVIELIRRDCKRKFLPLLIYDFKLYLKTLRRKMFQRILVGVISMLEVSGEFTSISYRRSWKIRLKQHGSLSIYLLFRCC